MCTMASGASNHVIEPSGRQWDITWVKHILQGWPKWCCVEMHWNEAMWGSHFNHHTFVQASKANNKLNKQCNGKTWGLISDFQTPWPKLACCWKGPKGMKTTCIGQAEDDLATSGLIMYIMASAASDLALKPLRKPCDFTWVQNIEQGWPKCTCLVEMPWIQVPWAYLSHSRHIWWFQASKANAWSSKAWPDLKSHLKLVSGQGAVNFFLSR